MAFQPFSLRYADILALDKLGLRLPGLRQTGQLLRGSRIEAPTSIISMVAPGAFLDVGAFCNLSGGTINNVRFGRYCSVASGVVIGPHEHPTDWLTTSRIAYYPEVNGWDALVAGPNLAKVHALHAAFPESCPNTDDRPRRLDRPGRLHQGGRDDRRRRRSSAPAPPCCATCRPTRIVVGTPGRVLRLRFPEATVERLLALEWWRYSLYDLFEAPMDSIDAALDVIEGMVAAGARSALRGPRHRARPRRIRRRWRRRSRRKLWPGPADRHPDQVALGADRCSPGLSGISTR